VDEDLFYQIEEAQIFAAFLRTSEPGGNFKSHTHFKQQENFQKVLDIIF